MVNTGPLRHGRDGCGALLLPVPGLGHQPDGHELLLTGMLPTLLCGSGIAKVSSCGGTHTGMEEKVQCAA